MTKLSSCQMVLTCEHATHWVPLPFQKLFRGQTTQLKSHRGWDPGTLALGQALAQEFDWPLFQTEVSRLLIEVNRSLHHPRLFSEFSRGLTIEKRQDLIDRYYLPYRNHVIDSIRKSIREGKQVIHLSLHSFTPVLDNVVRQADCGLLYDPSRKSEIEFSGQLRQVLRNRCPKWKVRRNYPYRGTADGFTTYLRTQFPGKNYAGIELEINQNLMVGISQANMIRTFVQVFSQVFGNDRSAILP